MTVAEHIKENLSYGQIVLSKLFELKFPELRAKVKEILSPSLGERTTVYDHLFDEGEVEKKFRNDAPWGIKISYFDQITIDAIGISLINEHATKSELLVWFDKNFKYE